MIAKALSIDVGPAPKLEDFMPKADATSDSAAAKTAGKKSGGKAKGKKKGRGA